MEQHGRRKTAMRKDTCERDRRRNETNRMGGACDRREPVARTSDSLPGGHSEREPPDPFPNSEVKTLCADGSVLFGHARVGHCQAFRRKTPGAARFRGFLLGAPGRAHPVRECRP